MQPTSHAWVARVPPARYGDDESLQEDITLWFGTVARSMYTLFQVVTLESWSMGIVRPVLARQPAMYAVLACTTVCVGACNHPC